MNDREARKPAEVPLLHQPESKIIRWESPVDRIFDTFTESCGACRESVYDRAMNWNQALMFLLVVVVVLILLKVTGVL